MLGLRTMVLNADMTPISMMPLEVIAAEDAVTRVHNGTCFVVEEYDRWIKTPTVKMRWPSIIARKHFLSMDRSVALNRENLYYRDHAVCAYCGGELSSKTITIDHVWPQSMGGKLEWENATAACGRCNSAKGSEKPVGKWAPRHKLYAPNYYQLLNVRRKFPISIGHPGWAKWLGEWEGKINVVDGACGVSGIA